MDSDSYLERLRSIREKYGCQKNYQYVQKNTEVLYPLTQTQGCEQKKKRIEDRSFTSYSPLHQGQQRFDFSKERTKEDNRPSRYYSSIDRRRLRDPEIPVSVTPAYGKSLGQRQLSEAQLKRQDNFNQFISDIDKRIEEKERLINQKFRENQLVLKKTQFETPDRPQRVKKYESQRQIREDTISSKLNYNYNNPRQAYEKSKSITKRYERDQQNAENELTAKINWNQSPKRNIRDYERIIRGDQNKKLVLTPSRDFLSKKLEGGQMIRKDGFNTQKLDSIQQRIQSVLKQSNR